MEFLAAFSLRESFLLRVIVALAVFLIAKSIFEYNVMLLVESMRERFHELENKSFYTLFHDIFVAKLDHWKYWCILLGYVSLTGVGPGEGMAYTFPMALYNLIYEINEPEFYWFFVLYLTFPLLIVTAFRIHSWLPALKNLAVSLVLSHHIKAIGQGMLIGQGFELLARLIGMGNPTSGDLLYFAFHILVNMGQILLIAYCGIHFVVGFLLSFISTEEQQKILIAMREKRERSQKESSSGGGGGDGGGIPSSAPPSKYPNFLHAGNGDTYRLEYDSGDHATYICDKTGHRQTVRPEDLDT